ncbi:glucose 1-dehydrogenase [Motilibacter aurantiacus]|uniref:glucose 1-dehydrogenase n=1 Tax=Motilibacter aurantiacus TaxID=2714955 RepID=UPI00140E7DC1|nr:glucose 1-dehydrogenase [Motilibacter aurantiacus]NHC44288.1 glucose 1-dehydrogenase [Motilibacter aurantiacus]
MRALTVQPGSGDPRVEDVAEPDPSLGPVLVEGLAVGVCGTDGDLLGGTYGDPPPGRERLIIGHESLGRVLEPGGADGLSGGDLVVGIVRRRDPEPCPACAAGEWDFCQNGEFSEHGIVRVDGFCAQRWRVEADHAVRVDPALGLRGVLLEPTSVVAKAWEQVERVGDRGHWRPRTALVTGAGPVGLLAALLAVQRGLETHVLDLAEDGPKPRLVGGLGAEYHSGSVDDLTFAPDVVVECTGAAPVVAGALTCVASAGVVCLAGVGPASEISFDAASVGREIVLKNNVVIGSVNANRRHYEAGARALADADPAWLDAMITRRVPLDRATEALDARDDDVKVVVDIAEI